MGFARDLGAAMTFGMSATTKHKEAETKYGNRRKQHEGRLNAYNEVQAQIQSSLEAMDAHFAAAQESLLSSGALTSDVSSNVIYGWYRPQEEWYIPQEEVEGVENNPDYARSFIGAIPTFGLGIGTPAAIWTLVGIYGTAATGTAIGALSGAARRRSHRCMDRSRCHSRSRRYDRWSHRPRANRCRRVPSDLAPRSGSRPQQRKELHPANRRSGPQNGLP